MATLYEPSGSVSEWKPRNGKTFSLRELQAAVGGDIELVSSVRAGVTACWRQRGQSSTSPNS